ncbi:M57 family metalloprotease [Microscilla marina]|uniref:Protease B n=1 Tax=Microscilla marina ATCC 23134 TaxID=313606 RepID=A1ZT12_MICM2|nr:M57 family metalloprotease [Microscilla marina]EAY26402.1 protease B [Microscilla marina ATCC 23134]
MKLLTKLSSVVLMTVVFFTFSCQQKEQDNTPKPEKVSAEVLTQIKAMGFSTEGVLKTDDGYIVENDIFIPTRRLGEKAERRVLLRAGQEEQYRTTNVVNSNGGRLIKVYIGTNFNSTYVAAVNEAIARYNELNLDLTFQRTTNSSEADIKVTRLSWFLELFGVLGSAGFPENGNPFGEIKLSGRLSYGVDGIATVMAHEMGHCIGFRHTDYFDRSISCGGSTNDEGDGGVGAIQIPGTPSGASVSAGSWMLACFAGSNRDFNADDVTALNWMYKGNF